MAKPKHIIITEDGVITQEALLAYAGGKLSPEETTQIETLLRDDPFAQDALEGMRSSAAPVEMKTIVTSLNTQLREKTGVRLQKKKGIEIHWATYAYAAVIVGILIGLGFVMIHFISDNDQRIAMNKSKTETQASAPITEQTIQPVSPTSDTMPMSSVSPATGAGTYMMTDSSVIGQKISTGNAVTSGASGPYTYAFTQADANKVSSYSQSTNQGVVSNAPAAADRKLSPAASPAAGQTAKPAAAKEESAKEKDDVKYSVNGYDLETGKEVKSQNYKSPVASNFESNLTKSKSPETVSVSASKKELKKEAAVADNTKTARALFDANNFKEAGKLYNKILSDQPDNSDALYFGGICDFYNGKGKQAEKNFDKLIKAGLYVDGSKWYKANVLIEKGKKDEAKQLLRDLVNTNSSFKDRAVKKYEEIIK